jgi:NAD(P)-dependent dehydrogenase (short-subunit alcohol dehydrogenase family)
VLADYSELRVHETATLLEREGMIVDASIVDVADRGAVDALAKAAEACGRIEAVIHTAGVSPTMATSQRIYEVDLVGTAHVIDSLYTVATPGMALVCIASMAGQFASLPAEFERHLATTPTERLLDHPGIDFDASSQMAYVVAKRANQLRVQAAAHLWGGKGARLNTISPGVISTPMGAEELEGPAGAMIQAMIDLSGARRIGTAEDIAAVASFLISPESAFITGNDLLVDGGAIAAQRWNAPSA